MRIFIFERIEECSDSYHAEGGLVVIAEDETQAKQMIAQAEHTNVTEEEWAKAESFYIEGSPTPRIWTFPDAGCC